MAPVLPLGKQGVLAQLRAGNARFWFGAPHPHVAVLLQDGVYRVRELVVDPAEARAASERARAGGEPYMPEHYYAMGQPTGRIFLEARTLEELIEKVEGHPWPKDW